MRIGYILSPETMCSGRSNGIRQQAMIWKRELEARGNEVLFLESSGDYDWKSFSLVHIFQGGAWLQNIVPSLRRRVRRIVFSPIIDSNVSPHLYHIASRMDIAPLRLRTQNAIVRKAALLFDLVLVRSEHEKTLVERGLGIDKHRVRLVKLGFYMRIHERLFAQKRARVCFHMSSYTQKRKNVCRLIEACKMIDLELWLAGNSGSPDKLEELKRLAKGGNVKFMGFVSDDEVVSLMTKAKVFALPSCYEGVGLAALEAAALGCEVVVTRNGGPRDYFADYANYVDPYSLKSITKALERAVTTSRQPELGEYIVSSCAPSVSAKSLEKVYKELL